MRKTEGEGETLLNHGVQKLRISVPWKQNGKEEEFWEVDEGKEPFVLELLSITEALLQVPLTSDAIQEDQKTGLLVIKLKNWLQLDEKSSPDLYLRKCQMELWNLVIECLEKDFKNARVVGSPGIGKSRSLTYLLMCLLKRRKKIVYEARKDNKVYVFWPTGESDYQVWSTKFPLKWTSGIMLDDEAFRIIDPGKAGEPIMNSTGHIILCCSPNREHYKDFDKLSIKTNLFIMPVWSKEELVSLCEITGLLSLEELELRYKDFGGRLRYVFSDKPNMILMEMTGAINRFQSVDKLAVALSPSAELDEQNVPSILFIYDVVKDGRYDNYSLTIASATVRHLLARAYWRNVMDVLNPNSLMHTADPSRYGRLIELLAGALLELGGKFEVYSFNKVKSESQSWGLSSTATGSIDIPSGTRFEILESDDETFRQQCLITFQKNAGSRTLCVPVSANPYLSTSMQPTIDFADSTSRVYQVTVGKRHVVKCFHLQKIIQTFQNTKDKPLQFYFVIPEHNREFCYQLTCGIEYDKKREELEAMDDEALATLTGTAIPHKPKENWRKDVISQYFKEKLQDFLQYVQFLAIILPKDPPSTIEETIKKVHKGKPTGSQQSSIPMNTESTSPKL